MEVAGCAKPLLVYECPVSQGLAYRLIAVAIYAEYLRSRTLGNMRVPMIRLRSVLFTTPERPEISSTEELALI